MRSLVLLLIVGTLGIGCAPRVLVMEPATPEQAAMDARADSLLSVAPDSLSEADWQWLQFYEQRRATRSATAQQAATAQTVERTSNAFIVYLILGLAVSAATTVLILATTADAPQF